MKRRLMLMIGMMVLLAVGAFVTAYVFIRSPINESNFERTYAGMTGAELEAILGPATETEDTAIERRVLVGYTGSDGQYRESRQICEKMWKGPSITIYAPFVESGRAAYVLAMPNQEAMIPRIRGWLGISAAPIDPATR